MGFNGTEAQWYQVTSDAQLKQGDFLERFPIMLQPLDMSTEAEQLKDADVSPDIEVYSVVIMTQSCDFQKLSDTDLVTLCPRSNYSDLYGEEDAKGKGRWKPLQEGRVVSAHLLNECSISGHKFEYQVVNLAKVFSVPCGYVKKVALRRGERIRLLSPYREHLAQAFAKRFMRVGLPIDLPEKFPY
jgi:hypothetical protein